MRVLIAPVQRHGIEQWKVWACDSTGKVVWEAVRWSETAARNVALGWIERNS